MNCTWKRNSSVNVRLLSIMMEYLFLLFYRILCIMFAAKKLPPDVDLKGVFACNQLDLREIEVYGFDYDYTLACYKPAMGSTLFNLGKDILINKFKVSNLRLYLTLMMYSSDIMWNIYVAVSSRNFCVEIRSWVCCSWFALRYWKRIVDEIRLVFTTRSSKCLQRIDKVVGEWCIRCVQN